MSLSGARGLARISQNPRCDLQTAMVIGQVDEIEFYEALTKQQFEGEYGERISARRRGNKFEASLHQNNAAELRRILAPRFGYDPERMYVRNLADEIPDYMTEVHRHRYVRTMRVFADVAGGCEPPSVPHLLIEPQLRLPVSDSRFVYVAPDFAVFDPATKCYVVGEEKSMIVRAGSPDRVDLERTRRQAGAEALALRLRAHQLGINFQNSCLSSCALFYNCKDRVSNTAVVLGDEAKDAFGGTTELEYLYALADGTVEAKSAEEVALAARLRETAILLGVEDLCSGKG